MLPFALVVNANVLGLWGMDENSGLITQVTVLMIIMAHCWVHLILILIRLRDNTEMPYSLTVPRNLHPPFGIACGFKLNTGLESGHHFGFRFATQMLV